MLIIYSTTNQDVTQGYNNLIVIPKEELPVLQKLIFKTQLNEKHMVVGLFDRLVEKGFVTRLSKRKNSLFGVSPFPFSSANEAKLDTLQLKHSEAQKELCTKRFSKNRFGID